MEDEDLKEEVIHVLEVELNDNVKAHLMQSDGSYVKPDRRGKEAVNSQDYFCEQAKQHRVVEKRKDKHIFEPITAPETEEE